MRVFGENFPLLVAVGPQRYDAEAVKRMADGFEEYFQRGERYAVISIQPKGSITPGPAERKLVLDWLESPRVRRYAGELCVGASTIMHGALMRGAFTAVLWFWKPPFPMETAATVARGVDYCVDRLRLASVRVPARPAELTERIERLLASVDASP
ncbi:MAG TPA: hypothetical protein VMG12_39150 [Polyangiaceae bacterium]|nr:hypothetical protein [Polyangiaceae bacterium]